MTPKQLVEKQGFAFLPSFLPHVDATAAGAALGVPEQVDGLSLVQELLPTPSGLTTPNTYSGNFGLGSFPFHTDLAHWVRPPRYVMLWCSRGDATTQTKIIDASSLIEFIGSSALTRCLARPRRPMNEALQLLPILQVLPRQDQQLFRWDSIYLKPSNEYAQIIFGKIQDYLSNVQPVATVLINKGDTIILDNWRLLHGRSQVKDVESSRSIHRIYLSSLI